jgi:hypothetical protein
MFQIYVSSVASKYFKVDGYFTWDARGKRNGARAVPARATFGGTGPRVAARDAGVGEQRLADAGHAWTRENRLQSRVSGCGRPSARLSTSGAVPITTFIYTQVDSISAL